MTDRILTDPPYSVRHELGRQTTAYGQFSKKGVAEMVEMCCNYQKLGEQTRMFCSASRISFWVNAVSTSTESITFGDAKENEQEREEVMLDQGTLRLLYVRGWENFKQNSEWKRLHNVCMVEHAG